MLNPPFAVASVDDRIVGQMFVIVDATQCTDHTGIADFGLSTHAALRLEHVVIAYLRRFYACAHFEHVMIADGHRSAGSPVNDENIFLNQIVITYHDRSTLSDDRRCGMDDVLNADRHITLDFSMLAAHDRAIGYLDTVKRTQFNCQYIASNDRPFCIAITYVARFTEVMF